jgi:hypothetical protein
MEFGRGDVLGLQTDGKKARQKEDGGDSDYGEMPQATSQHGWCSLCN